MSKDAQPYNLPRAKSHGNLEVLIAQSNPVDTLD
jgi:hypothetical protein